MAPVAGGITDADQYGLLLRPSPLESFGSPSVPIHGIVGVLEKIRRGLVLEVVHFLDLNGKRKSLKGGEQQNRKTAKFKM